MGQPPLRPLHRDESLNNVKLAHFERLQSAERLRSLEPGHADALEHISAARGITVPETAEQRAWLEAMAPELTEFGHRLVRE